MADATITLGRPGRQVSLRVANAARRAIAAAFGLPDLPQPNTVVAARGARIAWLRPDEWLVLLGAGATDLTEALAQVGRTTEAAAVDVSHARVSLMLSGQDASDVLSAECSLDLDPRVFRVGMCAQTVVGHAPVLILPVRDGLAYELLVQPSMVDYVRLLLEEALLTA